MDDLARSGDCVFPTQVGVFPRMRFIDYSKNSLPHTGGGVSGDHRSSFEGSASSPHRWGCFFASSLG